MYDFIYKLIKFEIPLRWRIKKGRVDKSIYHWIEIINKRKDKVRIISETEETWVNGGHYWYPTLDHNDYVRSDRFYTDVPIHTKLIRQGLVFKTEEDARIMAKALLNYTVEQRDE